MKYKFLNGRITKENYVQIFILTAQVKNFPQCNFFIGNSEIMHCGILINMPYGMILNFIYITYSQTADGLRLQALTPLPEADFPTQHRQHSGQSSVKPQSHSSSFSTTALPQNERLRATNKGFIHKVILLCLYRELQPQKN